MTLYLSIGFTLKLEVVKHMPVGLKTGELAERGSVNLQTIRYYEREGLLPKPPRSSSGYRFYHPDTVRRVRFIKRAQELGFSLAEIRELLTIRVDPMKDCADVRRLAHEKIADIAARIQTLERMSTVLAALAGTCPGCGPASECPILESIDSEK